MMIDEKVENEQRQRHATRQPIYEELENELGLPVISFFVSFNDPVMIGNRDADTLESVAQDIGTDDGIALILNAPGGDGLAAERIIRIFRQYSGSGTYKTFVPSKAKSAATMICFGSEEIGMGPTSELGPVDPQVVVKDANGNDRAFSAHNIIDSYNDLFDRALKTTDNLQPFMQQLDRYDERRIKKLERICELSDDIAVRSLKNGMMSGKSKAQIENDIEIFRTPEQSKAHGRPIHRDEAASCSLNIDMIGKNSDSWRLLRNLYVRLTQYLSCTQYSKSIETKDHAFAA